MKGASARYGDHLGEALAAIRQGGLRTFFAMLGILVGVAGVLGVDAIGQSGHRVVMRELGTFGLSSVWIYRDFKSQDPRRSIRRGTGIDADDFRALSAGCCPALQRLTPVVRIKDAPLAIHRGNRYSGAEVLGVDSAYTEINGDRLERGRGLRERDVEGRRNLVLLGAQVRRDLFGDGESPLGRHIRIGRQRFVVIGVIEHKSRDFLNAIGAARGLDPNRQVLIPYTSYQAMTGSDDIHWLQGQARSPDLAGAAVQQLEQALRRRNGEHFAYRSETMAKHLRTGDRILGAVFTVGLASASLALLVGGLGIAGIMSTSVLQRTREIGIRKAVGARDRDIHRQFLLEALVISLLGALPGLLLGLVSYPLLEGLTGAALQPSWQMVLGVLCVTVAVGLFSGYYPARRAAALNPVEALRYE